MRKIYSTFPLHLNKIHYGTKKLRTPEDFKKAVQTSNNITF